VLLVDDLADTGKTLKAVIDQLAQQLRSPSPSCAAR
jgi:hypoxanthine phosphoribosyltransferase